MVDRTLTTAALSVLERAINQALALDTVSAKAVGELSGRVIRLSCTRPAIELFVAVGEPLRLLQYYEDDTDASISGELADWSELLLAQDPGTALINGNLTVSGDSQLFLQLHAIAKGLELDWEGHLAKLIGDVPAYFFGRAAQSLMRTGQRSTRTLQRTLDDLLHEEARLVPSRIEIENFGREIRQLEMQLDRLQAKLERQHALANDAR